MHVRDLVSISFKSLIRNKARAVLTMLGIVIGIGSVILMLSVGKAAENFLLANVASFGPDVVIISNGSGDQSGGGPSPLQKLTLTYKDYRELKRQSWVESVLGTIVSTAVASDGPENMNVSLWGSTPGEIEIYPADLAEGAFSSTMTSMAAPRSP
ncbi:ABC transporter permease [Candidatus Uhrbacteria bacterium]|nr:MAG: ABC transporter permease [Candidatus Uhrbacteria bacterium]